VAEVAELLKLNQQTIRNMIDRGELETVRVGQRRVRVRQSVLDAFLAAGETMPTAKAPENRDRADLAVRLDRAREAIDSDDEAELAAALEALSELLHADEQPDPMR